MEKELLKIICCPFCKKDLKLTIFLKEKKKIKEGILKCEKCNKIYPIFNFIPRLLEYKFISIPKLFKEKYQIKLPEIKKEKNKENQTINLFNNEWTLFQKFGFKETQKKINLQDHKSLKYENTYEFTYKTFKRHTNLKEEDLKDKFILDCGCGTGRFAYVEYKMGGKVIGIDITKEIDNAQNNLKETNIQLIQASINNLPFKKEVFDIVLCLLVIMHTKNPSQSFKNMAEVLKRGGKISITSYAKGNIIYEKINKTIRNITTNLSKKQLETLAISISHIAKLFEWNKYLFASINSIIRIKNHKQAMFDWYGPKLAYHFSDEEINQWFKNNNILIIHTNDPRRNSNSFYSSLYPKWTKNKEKKVKKIYHKIIPRWGIDMTGIKK